MIAQLADFLANNPLASFDFSSLYSLAEAATQPAADHAAGGHGPKGITNLLSVEAIVALLTLTALEIVLGIDNIVFIAILVAKLPAEQQAKARRIGLGLAMGIRILLLLTISWIMGLTAPLSWVPKFWSDAGPAGQLARTVEPMVNDAREMLTGSEADSLAGRGKAVEALNQLRRFESEAGHDAVPAEMSAARRHLEDAVRQPAAGTGEAPSAAQLLRAAQVELKSINYHGISGRDLILLIGGLFLIGKATYEIHDKLEGPEHGEGSGVGTKAAAGFTAILIQILLLDIVFSLDSVITAVGMVTTDPQHKWKGISIMIVAVVIAVGVMLLAAGSVSRFVEKHPTVKMLALSFLILIGVMLVIEGLHQHIPKGYVYFAMAFALGVEMLNLRLRKVHKPVTLHHGYVDEGRTGATGTGARAS